MNPNDFKSIQNRSNFDRSKKGLLELDFFEIKYGFEGFDERNFLHRNFFRFEMDFELKSREVSMS
jgi:hypothetical protein